MQKFVAFLIAIFFSFLFSTVTLADENFRSIIFEDTTGKAISGAVVTFSSITAPSESTEFDFVMDQVNRQFVPEVLLINVGAQVRFPNSDDIRHHVYSLSRAKRFELKLYSGLNAPPVLFDTAGIVVLGCNIHDNMKGFVYVSDKSGAVKTDADGRVHLPKDVTSIEFWHPRLDPIVTTHHTIDIDTSLDAQVLKVHLAVEAQTKPAEKAVFGRGKLRHH